MKYKLGEICEIARGGSPRPIIDYITNEENGINWLKIGDVAEGDKYFNQAKERIKPEGRAKSRDVVKGDLILSNSMSFGRPYIVNIDGCIHDGWLRVRNNQKLVDRDYLYYFLCSDVAQNQFKAVAVGSVVNNLKLETVRDVEIDLPSLDVQKQIANILSDLDNKFENNRKINHHLEKMAQAIFKSWFVDFEPFGGFQPSSWLMGKAEDFFDIAIGKTPPRKEPEWFTTNPEDVVWVSISDMGSSGMFISNSSEYLTAESVKRFNVKIVPSNTVLLSFKLTVGRVRITDREMTTNEAIAHFKSSSNLSLEYLYFYLKTFNYQSLGNTSSIATAVNSKNIKAMPFVMPDQKILEDFHAVTAPMFEQVRISLAENDRLAELRDTLLPRLMSGELSVADLSDAI